VVPRHAITVVIPVHNGAELIGRALASVRLQSRPVTSVVVVDDGSTDDLAAALEEVHFDGQLVTQVHLGQGAALNSGIAQTDSELIAFLDHDDEWDQAKIAWQLEVIAQGACDVVIGSVVNRYVAGAGDFTDRPLGPARVLGAALMRRQVFEDVGGFPEDQLTHEIFDWWSRASGKVSLVIDPRPALIRYVHGGNQTLRPEHRDRRHLLARIRNHRHRHG
jgi:glycosyltransferase involved in cell wall biosynthesis